MAKCFQSKLSRNTFYPRSVLLGMFARKYMITQEDMRGQLAKIANPTEMETQLLCGHQRIPADVHHY